MESLYKININVKTDYIEDQSYPSESKYVFSYTVSIKNEGKIPAKLISRQWIITDANGKIEEVKDFYPTIDDWELHLTTIFPEARLKKFIEMRGADAGNINHVCALSAFWVGLMYDNNSLNAALELTKNISSEELVALRNIVPSKGLHSRLGKLDIYQLASEAISLSKDGLIRRNNLDKNNLDESYYLKYLEDIVIAKENPADSLMKKFKNNWNEDISKIYENCRF